MRLAAPLSLVPVLLGSVDLLAAQIQTLDISGRAVEIAVPAEYDGGFLERIGDVVVTDRGIWVVDWGQHKVLRFSPNGELMVEYGRDGSGPAEFMSIEAVRVDSIVTVEDPRQGRQVLFRLNGEHIETRAARRIIDNGGITVPVQSSVLLKSGAAVLEGRTYFTSASLEKSQPLTHVMLAYSEGTAQDTVFSYHSGLAMWRAGTTSGLLVAPFGVGGAWGLLGDTAIVLADGVNGTIAIVQAGSRSFQADTVDLGVVARPVSSRDRSRLREEEDLPRGAQMAMLPERWSVATDMIVDDQGDIWLGQAVEGDQEHWLVVTLDTRSRRRVVLPDGFELKAVHAGRLYGIARDELDVASVGVLADPRIQG